MFRGPKIFAYDIERNTSKPPSEYSTILEEQIKRKYSRPSGEDSIGWACSNEGREAYMTRTSLPKSGKGNED